MRIAQREKQMQKLTWVVEALAILWIAGEVLAVLGRELVMDPVSSKPALPAHG